MGLTAHLRTAGNAAMSRDEWWKRNHRPAGGRGPSRLCEFSINARFRVRPARFANPGQAWKRLCAALLDRCLQGLHLSSGFLLLIFKGF